MTEYFNVRYNGFAFCGWMKRRQCKYIQNRHTELYKHNQENNTTSSITTTTKAAIKIMTINTINNITTITTTTAIKERSPELGRDGWKRCLGGTHVNRHTPDGSSRIRYLSGSILPVSSMTCPPEPRPEPTPITLSRFLLALCSPTNRTLNILRLLFFLC